MLGTKRERPFKGRIHHQPGILQPGQPGTISTSSPHETELKKDGSPLLSGFLMVTTAGTVSVDRYVMLSSVCKRIRPRLASWPDDSRRPFRMIGRVIWWNGDHVLFGQYWNGVSMCATCHCFLPDSLRTWFVRVTASAPLRSASVTGLRYAPSRDAPPCLAHMTQNILPNRVPETT